MLYHEREHKNKENANFVYIVYLLTRLCNIVDEAFFIDVSICFGAKTRKIGIPLNTPVLLYKSGVHGGIFFLLLFLIQFYVHFKIISAHMRGANQSVVRKRENPEKKHLACGQCGAQTHTRHSGEMIE